MQEQSKLPFMGQGHLHWTLKKFEELTPFELYALLQLRNGVFVVEQNCPYQDADNKDLEAHHLMGWNGEILVAYSRLIPPGVSYAEASIGRVVSNSNYRRTGAGRRLMELSIKNSLILFNCNSIKIGAQLYLKKFYESLGFVQCSNQYLEDNIPHIEMLYTANT